MRCGLATRAIYRCMLRAAQTLPDTHKRLQVTGLIRAEFRCSEMASYERSLDDAIEILRNWTALEPTSKHPAARAEPLLCSPAEVSRLLCRDWPMPLQHVLLDVRTHSAHALEHIPSAMSVPWIASGGADFVLRAAEHGLRPDSRVILVGADQDVLDAAAALRDVLGINLSEQVVILRGGHAAWCTAGLTTMGLRVGETIKFVDDIVSSTR